MVQPITGERGLSKRSSHRVTLLLRWAAILAIASLLAHAVDAPDHLKEWWGYSTYFVVAGAFQFFYGFGLILKPWRYDENGALREDGDQHGRSFYMLGLVLSVSVVLLYIVTRTTGLPLPGAGVEKVTVLSLVPIIENLPLIYCLEELWRLTRAKEAEIRSDGQAT